MKRADASKFRHSLSLPFSFYFYPLFSLRRMLNSLSNDGERTNAGTVGKNRVSCVDTLRRSSIWVREAVKFIPVDGAGPVPFILSQ